MHRRRFLKRGVTLGVSLLAPWAVADPRDVDFGVDVCPFCNMPVVDGRFAAQAITEGGRILTYDAIECLLDHEAGYGPPPPVFTERWVADRLGSSMTEVSWLDAEEDAVLLFHPRLRTPMGGGLAAFLTVEDAQAFAARNLLEGAETLTWVEASERALVRPWVPAW